MDQLMEANTINSKVDENDFATFSDGKMMESDDKEKNMVPRTPSLEDAMTDEEEENMELTTLRIKTSSNDPKSTPKEIGST